MRKFKLYLVFLMVVAVSPYEYLYPHFLIEKTGFIIIQNKELKWL